MLRTILIATLTLLAAGPLLAQSALQFEVAAIKPAPPQPEGRTSTRTSSDTDKGQLNYSNVNLKEMISLAYKIPQYRINGPEWLQTGRFDVVARFAPKSNRDDVPLMLQVLLADRFHLKVHRETKEMPIYTMTVAQKGTTFKSIETSSGISSNSNRTARHAVAKVAMVRFAEFLSNEVGRPVLDGTGLTGAYEMTLDWALDGAPGADTSTTLPSIFTALTEQLGLKLQASKGQVEILIVDSADRTPTEN